MINMVTILKASIIMQVPIYIIIIAACEVKPLTLLQVEGLVKIVGVVSK